MHVVTVPLAGRESPREKETERERERIPLLLRTYKICHFFHCVYGGEELTGGETWMFHVCSEYDAAQRDATLVCLWYNVILRRQGLLTGIFKSGIRTHHHEDGES